MKKLFMAVLFISFAVAVPSRAVWAADSVNIVACSSGLINFEWDVADVSQVPSIIIWDGSNSDNFTEILLNSAVGEAKGDFASFWGGASNASLAIYLAHNTAIADSCD